MEKIKFRLNKKEKERVLKGFLFSFLLIFLVTGFCEMKKERMQQEIAKKIVRFHVLANSDSKEDQELKLAVRDAVGTYLSAPLSQVSNKKECEEILAERLDGIKKTAAFVIKEHGYSYGVTAEVKKTQFPIKKYGSYTFPAGSYDALEVTIGEGKGHNWWCVMYPNMCFSGSMYEVIDENAKKELQEVLDSKEYEAILKDGNYKIEFKYLTFLNSLCNVDDGQK